MRRRAKDRELIIRRARSLAEADRFDRADIARSSAADRLLAAREMCTGTYGHTASPRLARCE